MSERRITRRRGEGLRIDGPATIRVDRRVTLIVEAPRAARVDRLPAHRAPGARRAGKNVDPGP
jgi:predicted pyridoxine 5'-phosphate oxidase superfamily flavin-nucleotide-binding protein